jgi:hypothetical protein
MILQDAIHPIIGRSDNSLSCRQIFPKSPFLTDSAASMRVSEIPFDDHLANSIKK